MKRRTPSVVTGALLVGAMVVALASPAWAPRAWGIPNLIAPCGEGKTFLGSLFINDFDSKLTLTAQGSVVGACRETGDTSATGAVDTTFDVAATLEDASCDSISVAIADLDGGHDITIDMSDEAILLDNPTQDRGLRKLMCQVAGRSRSVIYERHPERLAADLDRILLALAGL